MKNDLFYGTRGPRDAKVVVVGESWGAEEAANKMPFVGSSGTELMRMLADAGIDSSSILFTNMVAEKPHGNETWRLLNPNPLTPAQLTVLRLLLRLATRLAVFITRLHPILVMWSLRLGTGHSGLYHLKQAWKFSVHRITEQSLPTNKDMSRPE